MQSNKILDQRMQFALNLHAQGRCQDAEKQYREILATNPDHPHANHMMGVLSCQNRKFESGIHWMQKALRVSPNLAQAHGGSWSAFCSDEGDAEAGTYADDMDAYMETNLDLTNYTWITNED